MASGSHPSRLLLTNAAVVLPGRTLSRGTVVVEDGVIVDVLEGTRSAGEGDAFDCAGGYVVPGFVDVHVHGVEGVDALDAGTAIRTMAERLPRYGVTAFCPTSIACAPDRLTAMLEAIREVRTDRSTPGARVLPAHLESNFINPEYKGAQPGECLRTAAGGTVEGAFAGSDILDVIDGARSEVGIMTVAPEIDGVLSLIPRLVASGIQVSIGHSGGTYEDAVAAIEAGARQATHLFNRMPPLNHRKPGLTGAVLERPEVTAEIVCDGVHVHQAMVRVAAAAKGPDGVMAITDGTAGSGLPPGSKSVLGGRRITVRDAAYLDDGTLAGSVLTMNRAFAFLIEKVGLPPHLAGRLCATNAAAAMGMDRIGSIVQGAAADLAVLDRSFDVIATWRAGACIWCKESPGRGTRPSAPPSIRT